MILILECIIGCIVFGTFIVLSVLKNKDMWIQEYPESVQRRYIELHPDINIKEPEGLTPRVICMKLGACIMFLMLLTVMVYLAGAKTFIQGALCCYTIWFVVNAFDTFVLDRKTNR